MCFTHDENEEKIQKKKYKFLHYFLKSFHFIKTKQNLKKNEVKNKTILIQHFIGFEILGYCRYIFS